MNSEYENEILRRHDRICAEVRHGEETGEWSEDALQFVRNMEELKRQEKQRQLDQPDNCLIAIRDTLKRMLEIAEQTNDELREINFCLQSIRGQQ